MRPAALALVLSVLVSAPLGCGRRPALPAPKAKPAQAVQTPLPSWAPANPSKEFLRAARVVKPLPPEVSQQLVGDSVEGRMVAKRAAETFPAAYEFLGTLTDAQLARLQSKGEIRVPVRSLTTEQRAALEAWFDSWQRAFKGASVELRDYRLILYKAGARQDLSNMDTGFKTMGSHIAHLMFWVRKPDGSETATDFVFAQM